MKFFVIFAICVAGAAASTRFILPGPAAANEMAEIQQILEAINHPSTNPATAAALEQMLHEMLGTQPINVGPAIVDNESISVGPAIVEGEYELISVGPAIVDGEYEPISVGPAIVDEVYEPISVGPAIVEEVAPSPVVPSPESSPLVQIIVNIKSGAGNPVSVEGIEPTPVIVAPSPIPEIEPTPVIVAPGPVPAPEPVLVAPIVPAPVVLPDILN